MSKRRDGREEQAVIEAAPNYPDVPRKRQKISSRGQSRSQSPRRPQRDPMLGLGNTSHGASNSCTSNRTSQLSVRAVHGMCRNLVPGEAYDLRSVNTALPPSSPNRNPSLESTARKRSKTSSRAHMQNLASTKKVPLSIKPLLLRGECLTS